jgi:hypothetical protein
LSHYERKKLASHVKSSTIDVIKPSQREKIVSSWMLKGILNSLIIPRKNWAKIIKS